MRHRERRRVDWDEEIRKTERIRRRGFFISALGFVVATVVITAVSGMNGVDAELSRKVIFAACLVLSFLVLRITFRRRERLKREREEQDIERMLQGAKNRQNTEE